MYICIYIYIYIYIYINISSPPPSSQQVGQINGLDSSPLCLGAWDDVGKEKLAVGDDVGFVTLYTTIGALKINKILLDHCDSDTDAAVYGGDEL